MWIFMKEAFLSIVSKDCQPDELLVRARRKGDIERVFPDAAVERTPGNDYLYRARIKREDMQKALAVEVALIDYPNFKGSVRDNRLHSAYGRVWHAMADLQEIPPYSIDRPARRRQGGLLRG